MPTIGPTIKAPRLRRPDNAVEALASYLPRTSVFDVNESGKY